MSDKNVVENVVEDDPAEKLEGFGWAYRFLDPKTRLYEIATSRFEAERLAGGECEKVRVHFTDGHIDRIIECDNRDETEPTDAGVADSPSLLDEWLEEGGPSEILRTFDSVRSEDRGQHRSQHEDFLDEWLDGQSSGARSSSGSKRSEDRSRHCDQPRSAHHPDHPENGIGLAYRYRDPKSGSYGWMPEASLARSIAGDNYEVFWVRYRNGAIDHAVTEDEWRGELEVRIGERISEGLSEAKLVEFDGIQDQDEATRWLKENRPDYLDIVNRTRNEMNRGLVMDNGKGVRPEA